MTRRGVLDPRTRYRVFLSFARAMAARRDDRSYRLGDLGYICFSGVSRFLSTKEVSGAWREFLSGPFRPRLCLIFSTPYCGSRCDFCIFYKDECAAGSAQLESYKDRLVASAAHFSRLFRGARFSKLNFDGGTPTLFSEAQLEELCGAMARFSYEEGCVRIVETHPDTTTPGKLKVLREGGFNQVTVGVQSTSGKALRTAGRRRQNRKTVADAVAWSRAAGFESVGVDLLLGMPSDDGSLFFRSFQETAAMRPDVIVVYVCTPSAFYLKEHFAGRRPVFEEHMKRLLPWLERARAWAAGHGYETAPGDPGRNADGIKFFRSGMGAAARQQEYNYDNRDAGQAIFNLGDKRVSRVGDTLKYETLALADDPLRNKYLGWMFSAEDRWRLYILEQFDLDGGVSMRDFREHFGKDLDEVFAEGLSALRGLGLADGAGGSFRLRAAAGTPERFAAVMFLFDYGRLAGLVNGMLGRSGVAVRLGGREHRLEVAYDESGRGVFSLALPEGGAASPAARSLFAAFRRIFAELEAADEDRDLEAFTVKFQDALSLLLRRTGGVSEGLRGGAERFGGMNAAVGTGAAPGAGGGRR